MNHVEKMRRSRRGRRSGCRRNRMRGGTGGFGYSFGGPVAGSPIVNNYGQEVVRYASCGDTGRAAPSVSARGLPGLSGGARYTNTFEVVGPAGIAITNPISISCDVAKPNPYNLTGPDRVTALAPATELPKPGVFKGGRRCWTSKRKRQNGGVGGVDSQFYIAPRAGYTTMPSDMAGGDSGLLADGKTPFLLNVPYENKPMANPACLKTGGRRKSRKVKHRKSKKGKKHSRRK